jgi:histidinol-phosphatase (PHP family)
MRYRDYQVDYHIHSTFSDGKNTPEEIILKAIDKGMTEIGFSDHSYTFFDESYCINKDDIKNYQDTIRALSLKYKDKIKVLCGIEQDFYSAESTDNYDYIIGSVHYVKINDEYVPVDENPETLIAAAEKYFNGDLLSLAEEYFKTVAKVVEKSNCDIIGHFDLITKFNECNKLFDETSPRYRKAATDAVMKLLKYNRPFEINTGAISRGYRTTPYPSKEILDLILKNGGKVVFSSDSHSKDTVGYYFENL